MPTLLSQAAAFVDEIGWPSTADEDRGLIQTTYQTEAMSLQGYLHVYEDRRQLVFYTLFPTHVERPRFPEAVEFVTRANYGLANGNFEIHWGHGGVRFKTSLSLGKAEFQPALLRPLLFGNVITMYRYGQGLQALIETGCTAEEAIALVEDSN